MKFTIASIILAASSVLASPMNTKRSSALQISDFAATAGRGGLGASMQFVLTDPNYPGDTPTDCNLIWYVSPDKETQ